MSKASLTNKFKCPDCGSSRFGTSDCIEWTQPKGHCHGFKKNGERCLFTWCRLTQDEKVFTGAKIT